MTKSSKKSESKVLKSKRDLQENFGKVVWGTRMVEEVEDKMLCDVYECDVVHWVMFNIYEIKMTKNSSYIVRWAKKVNMKSIWISLGSGGGIV